MPVFLLWVMMVVRVISIFNAITQLNAAVEPLNLFGTCLLHEEYNNTINELMSLHILKR